ncbi:MAG: hypothetical protein HWE15_13090 [Algoriphagus sp.]|uniref:hypothetical protein n=1 Tax=Algoriphagus sp. TaxID=1872435 RepID=UPI00180D1D61|nr:hypothetical protein [Algoriphagus sp.]NVJ87240.1 hypothetical protein [Algoriphagus sp.]
MDWRRIIRFKVGGELWEVPLYILVLMVLITLFLMAGGAYLGFQFGTNQVNP